MTRFSFRRAGRAQTVVGDIAAQAGKPGIEICDVSGHVEEVAARVQHQAQVCRALRESAAQTLADIHGLAEGVTVIESQIAAQRFGACEQRFREDFADRPADASAGAQRLDRSGRSARTLRGIRRIAATGASSASAPGSPRRRTPSAVCCRRTGAILGGGQFVLMKNAYAPVFVGGRHWGAVRLAYKV